MKDFQIKNLLLYWRIWILKTGIKENDKNAHSNQLTFNKSDNVNIRYAYDTVDSRRRNEIAGTSTEGSEGKARRKE